MSYTQSDLDSLRKAMAKGVLRAKYGERDITYRSMEEMERQERRMVKALGQASTTRYYPTFGNGL